MKKQEKLGLILKIPKGKSESVNRRRTEKHNCTNGINLVTNVVISQEWRKNREFLLRSILIIPIYTGTSLALKNKLQVPQIKPVSLLQHGF